MHKKDMVPEEMPTLMLLNEVSKLFHDRMRVEGDKVGMQSGYRRILFHLVNTEDGITQLDLAKMINLKPPTVSVSLQKMEQAGLVRRQTDEKDLRQTRVFLTEKGRQLDVAVYGKLKETEALFLKDITQEQQDIVKKILIKMRSNAINEGRYKRENETD